MVSVIWRDSTEFYQSRRLNLARLLVSLALAYFPLDDICNRPERGRYFLECQLTQNPLRYILSCYDAMTMYCLFLKSYEPLRVTNKALGDSIEIERRT